MTASRRIGKFCGRPGPAAILLRACRGLALLACLSAPGPALADPFAASPHSGVAIYGYDPVAYFTDQVAVLGRGEIEANALGVAWRFRSEANRAVFLAAPEVYAPRFGGYDPVAVARGVPSPGHPQIWALVDGALYLFQRLRTRERFLSDPAAYLRDANARWPAVAEELQPDSTP